MKKVEEMEYSILGNGQYDEYLKMSSDPKNDALRYMMAISYSANENSANDKIAFLGGAGVVGNLVGLLGEMVIPQWRGTHDLDVLLRERCYESAIKNVFDDVDTYSPSLSIKNKFTLRGKSADSENHHLNSMAVDIYHPNGNPKGGIRINENNIDSDYWD